MVVVETDVVVLGLIEVVVVVEVVVIEVVVVGLIVVVLTDEVVVGLLFLQLSMSTSSITHPYKVPSL